MSFATLGENGEPFVERRDELAALYDQSPGFIAIAEGPNHTFTFANAAYKKFVNKQNLIGQTVLEAMPGLVQQGILDILDQVYQTGIAYVGSDVEMLFDDGRSESPVKRYCDFVYQPIRAEDGSIKGLFCEGYDVTEKHLAAESMSQLQSQVIHLSRSNAMGTMAATLAHELQQPITAIGNYSVAGRRHLARSDKDAIDQASSALEAIKELAERTGLLIKNLRDLTAQRQSQWVEFNLHDAIVECISLVEAAIGQPVAIVAKSVESLLVNADRIQIQQVLINLLKNACECSENARELNVEISATLNRDQIRVCVKDTGTGISAEVANSLFCLGRSRKADGMGIGLSVSRTIIESHGGKIWLESTSSAGSLFCFEIPASQSQIGGNV